MGFTGKELYNAIFLCRRARFSGARKRGRRLLSPAASGEEVARKAYRGYLYSRAAGPVLEVFEAASFPVLEGSASLRFDGPGLNPRPGGGVDKCRV